MKRNWFDTACCMLYEPKELPPEPPDDGVDQERLPDTTGSRVAYRLEGRLSPPQFPQMSEAGKALFGIFMLLALVFGVFLFIVLIFMNRRGKRLYDRLVMTPPEPEPLPPWIEIATALNNSAWEFTDAGQS